MVSDSSFLVKKIRYLTLGLMISGAINIGLLIAFIYWVTREQLPMPYCELKPIAIEQSTNALSNFKASHEVIDHFKKRSFAELVRSLNNAQIIENGYSERELALAFLISDYHFDVHRGLPEDLQPKKKRLLTWNIDQQLPLILTIYPDLSQLQYEALIRFAKIEQWPFTSQYLFKQLQEQSKMQVFDQSLLDTFSQTSEFWTVEALFNRSEIPLDRQKLLYLALEGSWTMLEEFTVQQRQLHDQSDRRRQKFLLDYMLLGSKTAALLLLQSEWNFSLKKLSDEQMIALIDLLPLENELATKFVKEVLISPRSSEAHIQATNWLLTQLGEKPTKEWNYQKILERFAPEASIKNFQSTVPLKISAQLNVSLEQNKQNIKRDKTKIVFLSKSQNHNSTIAQTPQKKEFKKFFIYEVKEGDSLWKISRQFNKNLNDIKIINHLNSDQIKPGMKLKIPSTQNKMTR